MKAPLLQAFHFIKLMFKSAFDGQIFVRSAALTYSTMLTFLPFLLTVFFIVRLFPIYESFGVNLEQFIILNFVPSFGDQILEYVKIFERQSEALPRYSIISLIITVMILLVTVEDTLNDTWQVSRKRKMSLSIAINWLLLLFGPIFLLASIIFSSMLASFEWLDVFQVISDSLSIKFVPFILSIFSFSLFYYIVPHCKVRFKHALIGGVVASILFELTKKCMGLYLYYVPSYSVLYGTLTALPFLMLWIYIVWIVFFVGGLVVNILRLQSWKSQQGHKVGIPEKKPSLSRA